MLGWRRGDELDTTKTAAAAAVSSITYRWKRSSQGGWPADEHQNKHKVFGKTRFPHHLLFDFGWDPVFVALSLHVPGVFILIAVFFVVFVGVAILKRATVLQFLSERH